jgi:putative DNA primase/helicase
MAADIERIRDALSFIHPDDRATWVRMAMAIKAELGDPGFELFDTWSQGGDSYSARDVRDVWKSINGTGGVTIATLFHEAKARGWIDNGTHQRPAAEELAERRRVAAERTAKEETRKGRQHAEAATKAKAIWDSASPARDDHPYLARKQVLAVASLREIHASAAEALLGYAPASRSESLTGRLVVVPVKVAEKLSTLELIDESGRKSALYGGAKSGGYWAAQQLPEGGGQGITVLVGEGVATVLSAREATGYPAVAALSSGNLEPVARAIRQRYPAARLVILADLVKDTGDPDPHAMEAARAVGGRMASPAFGKDRPRHLKDFNDLALDRGLEAVRAAIAGAKAPAGGNGAAPGADNESRVVLLRGDGLRVEPIRWLWDGWLARGKLHMLAGAPGSGKSTIALTLAAVVTAGGCWPDGTECTPGQVLVWSGEDDPADTLLPRLLAAGGDPRRFHIVTGTVDRDGPRQFDPATDIPALLIAAGEIPACSLVLVDPVVTIVPGDSHKNVEVRRALQPLVGFASALDAAVLGISHFTKGTAGRDPVERVTGSVAFGALPRVVMAAARVREADTERRIFCRAKSNIGPDTGGWEYRLDLVGVPGTPGVAAVRARWGEVLKGSARDLLAEAEATGDAEEQSELDEAVGWLSALLENGPVDSKQIRSDAKQAGIAWRTVERGKTRLGVKLSKAGYQGKWRWSLLDHSDPQPNEDPTPENFGGLGGLWESEALEPSCGAGSTKDRQHLQKVPKNTDLGGLWSNQGGMRVPGDREVKDRQDRQCDGDCAAIAPREERETLRVLVDDGLVARTGEGRRGDPCRRDVRDGCEELLHRVVITVDHGSGKHRSFEAHDPGGRTLEVWRAKVLAAHGPSATVRPAPNVPEVLQ